MNRFTTDDPRNNMDWMHNMTEVIDREVFLPDCSGDGVRLVDYCAELCRKKCGSEFTDNDLKANVFGKFMVCDCEVAILYWLAVGYAENRQRLMDYEDSGLTPEEITELAEAKREGRLVVLPCAAGDKVFYRHNPHPESDIEQCEVTSISVGRDEGSSWVHVICPSYGPASLNFRDFGRIVFTTREAAEKAWGESEGE